MAKLDLDVEINVEKFSQQLKKVVSEINDELAKVYNVPKDRRSGTFVPGAVTDVESSVFDAVARMDETIREMTKPTIFDQIKRWYILESSKIERQGGLLAVMQNFQRSFVNALQRVYQAVGIVLAVEVLKRLEQYFGRFSGYLQTAVQLIDVFVNLLFKPIADVVGLIIIPILMPVLKLLARILPVWNNIVTNWVEGSGGSLLDDALGQLGLGVVGWRLGGPIGAIIGVMMPMIVNSVLDWIDKELGIEIPDWLKMFAAEGGTLFLLAKGMTALSSAVSQLLSLIGVGGAAGTAGAAGGTLLGAISSVTSSLGTLASAIGAVVAVAYGIKKLYEWYEEYTDPVNQMLEQQELPEGYNKGGLRPLAQTVSYTPSGSPVTATNPSGYIVDKYGNPVPIPSVELPTGVRSVVNNSTEIVLNVDVHNADAEEIGNTIVDRIKTLAGWGGG